MISKAIQRIRNNLKDNVGRHVSALGEMQAYGLIDLLRERAKPAFIPPTTENFAEVVKIEYARSHGYTQAIDDLVNVIELYVAPNASDERKAARLDFSGRRLAHARGDLTDEDLEELERRDRQ